MTHDEKTKIFFDAAVKIYCAEVGSGKLDYDFFVDNHPAFLRQVRNVCRGNFF